MYGPSRFVWFTIGSVATWAWMRSHHHEGGCSSARVCYDSRAQRERVAPYGSAGYGHGDQQPQQQQQQQDKASWGWRQGAGAPPDSRFDAAARAPSDVSADGGRQGPAAEAPQFPVDPERERLRQLGRSAEETISGMSEATIDSMMGGLQRLKERLAERRSQQLQESQQRPPTPAAPATPPEDPSLPRHWV
ncbi:hypothetical protein BJV78DRAFT_1151421 [Lactifluus subvellereus]|nr:hypothetical protein BJV78DRAFT_1151421 [Lactifluus subvellereus]